VSCYEAGSGSIFRSKVWIATKILSFVHWYIANLPGKFHANPLGSFYTKLLTDRQTDKQTMTITGYISSMVGVIDSSRQKEIRSHGNVDLEKNGNNYLDEQKK